MKSYLPRLKKANELDTRVIAVTSTTYTTITRRIVDFDISFEEDHQWGDAIAYTGNMDLQNIATHEHSLFF
ncbi:MAG: hypothetical protein OIN87_06810 [Candidatus Methanoperedens sp.]|nr:hypothetical protein [Candidatus Methanoperedens sp.]